MLVRVGTHVATQFQLALLHKLVRGFLSPTNFPATYYGTIDLLSRLMNEPVNTELHSTLECSRRRGFLIFNRVCLLVFPLFNLPNVVAV